MKKTYIAPEFEKVTLNTTDVMNTSGELEAGVTLGTWGGSDNGMSLGGEDFGWGM